LAAGVFVALFAAANYPALTWAAGLIGMIGGCVNWALMVNMTMYTCLPKRRSTANAVQMFTGHILGKSVRFTFRVFRNHKLTNPGKFDRFQENSSIFGNRFPKSGRPSKKSDFSRTNFLMKFFR
jgi:hypothetical protein